MLGKTLLAGAIVGALVYALLRTHRQISDERHLQRQEHLRWEDEGGAPMPQDTSSEEGSGVAAVYS